MSDEPEAAREEVGITDSPDASSPQTPRRPLDWQYVCGFGLVLAGVLAVAWALRAGQCKDCAGPGDPPEYEPGEDEADAINDQLAESSFAGDDAPLVGSPVDPDDLVVVEAGDRGLELLGVDGATDLGESLSGVAVPVLADQRVSDLV